MFIHPNNYENYLFPQNNDKHEIRNGNIEYIAARYDELHDKPFLIFELLSALSYEYGVIIYQIKYLINEDILKYDGTKEQIDKYKDEEFIRFEIRKGQKFAEAKGKIPKNRILYNPEIMARFPALNLAKCNEELDKAINNLEDAPDSSLGNACSFIESVAKHILDYNKIRYPNKQDIQSLIKECIKVLDLSPDDQANKDLKTITHSIANIANSIGSIRTHFSDFHGKGINFNSLDIRHARYIVGISYSLSMFLIESFYETINSKNKAS